VLAPLLEIDVLHAIEIYKALVDAIAEISRRLLADDAHYPTREFPIQFIIAAEYGDLFMRVLLGYLVICHRVAIHLSIEGSLGMFDEVAIEVKTLTEVIFSRRRLPTYPFTHL
jgi:hypothetical protein